ncbi:unnamed protein product [Adineta ricciae]|uniref:Uncharacterized protein n=1 Tax=Adineta ricciae TaxID=249248 RepID=A0A814BN06_ADIRI|nr:unnamed protein product [Adineta ricciae]
MASFLSRTQALFQLPRYVPALIARAQASQNVPPTPGSVQSWDLMISCFPLGVPLSGSTTKTVSQTGGTKKGDSSVLPKSSTSSDHTNPTKTSSDAPSLDHNSVDLKNKEPAKSTSSSSSKPPKTSSSSSDDSDNKTSLDSPFVQYGTIVVLAVTAYLCYKMMTNRRNQNRNDLINDEHYERATADYQSANMQGTDVKK